MKKGLAVLIAVLLLLGTVACDSVSTPDIQKPITPGTDNQPTAAADSANSEATIEEVVLMDEAGIKITAKELSSDSFFGPEIKVLVENSSELDLTVQTRNVSVNGYMMDPLFSVDVASGKKANDSITFSDSSLEKCGIETIADIELSFHIFTTEDWETHYDSPLIQLKTSAADSYTYNFDDSGEMVYEQDDIKIVVKGLSDDDILGPEVLVYIYNGGQDNITVQTRNVSVNGFMVDPIFSSDVGSGKHCVDSISFLSSDLEDNGITEITSLELVFHIFNSDSWDSSVDTDPITLNFA